MRGVRQLRGINTKPFSYLPLFNNEANPVKVAYKQLDVPSGSIRVTKGPDGLDFLKVDTSAITSLSRQAMTDINFFFRTSQLVSLRKIFDDPESSANDRFVAFELLRN